MTILSHIKDDYVHQRISKEKALRLIIQAVYDHQVSVNHAFEISKYIHEHSKNSKKVDLKDE